MTADRPPVKQATNAESRYEQHKNQQGHRHEPAEAHPGPENEVDSFQVGEPRPAAWPRRGARGSTLDQPNHPRGAARCDPPLAKIL